MDRGKLFMCSSVLILLQSSLNLLFARKAWGLLITLISHIWNGKNGTNLLTSLHEAVQLWNNTENFIFSEILSSPLFFFSLNKLVKHFSLPWRLIFYCKIVIASKFQGCKQIFQKSGQLMKYLHSVLAAAVHITFILSLIYIPSLRARLPANQSRNCWAVIDSAVG